MQMGFWAHVRQWIAAPSLAPSRSLLFMSAFMVFFSVVIALFKDIPDIRGDQLHATRTASVRFGVQRVFHSCVWMLHAAYACALGFVLLTTSGVTRLALLGLQGAMPWLLQRRVQETDLQNHASIVGAYMFVWKLFYAQYLLFPLMA